MALLPESRLLQFNPQGATSNLDIPYDDIEVMTLTEPVAGHWQEDLVSALGADPGLITKPQAYELQFLSGDVMHGLAIGTVIQQEALFLFQSIGADQVLRHFIPMSSLRSYNLGTNLAEPKIPLPGINPDAVDAQHTQAAGGAGEMEQVVSAMRISTRADLERVLVANSGQPIKRLGQVLLDLHLVSAEQLSRALELQKETHASQLGQTLVDMNVISEEVLKRALQSKLGIPSVDLYAVLPDTAAVRMLDVKIASKFNVMPVLLLGEAMVVAVADPLDPVPLEAARFAAGRQVIPVMVSATQIRDSILRYYDGISGEDLRTAAGAPAQFDAIPWGRAGYQGAHQHPGRAAGERRRRTPVAAR